MGLTDDIETAVREIVNADWNVRVGRTVPETEDITLSNGAVELDAVYLYADMADSTGLARDFAAKTAAKVIRSYLDATCRVIRARGGAIRSFDGDRVMAIFIGKSKNTSAAQCGLQINHVVSQIVRPAVERRFPPLESGGFTLSHCVGIASGKALIVRGGVWGHNDLVSVGRAPNVAAKLSDVRKSPYVTYVTDSVYKMMHESVKYGGERNELMWKGPLSREVGGKKISVYKSSWRRKP